MTEPADLVRDARTLLDAWRAPDAAQEELRCLFLDHVTVHSDGADRSCSPDHLTASALIADADGTRFALVLHPKFGRWLQTGGHCEPADRTVCGAAAREAREESGIDTLVVDPVPLLLSRHPVRCWPGGHHLDVQFLAIAPPTARLQVSEESEDLRWFDLEEIADVSDETVRALVAAARTRLRGNHGPTRSSRID